MAQNPAIQKKAQAVVDEAVKAEGGLPDFAHYQKLPYVEAIVREVLRWKPVAPVGEPTSPASVSRRVVDKFSQHFLN